MKKALSIRFLLTSAVPLLAAIPLLAAALVLFSISGSAQAQDAPSKAKIKTSTTAEHLMRSSPKSAPASERMQCEAMTSKGKQCSRKAAEGQKYCTQHMKMMAKKAAMSGADKKSKSGAGKKAEMKKAPTKNAEVK